MGTILWLKLIMDTSSLYFLYYIQAVLYIFQVEVPSGPQRGILGNHGYDNQEADMGAVFLATGPSKFCLTKILFCDCGAENVI